MSDPSPFNFWQVLEDADRDEVLHIIPLTDPRAHEATVRCWCTPRKEPHKYGDAFVHSSLAEPQQIH